MITQKRKFFYQPGIALSLICWSWTFIVLLFGIIYWLEITHFQTVTLIFFILFFVLSFIQIRFRRIIIDGNTMTVKSVLHPKGRNVNINEIINVSVSHWQLSFTYEQKQYSFVLPANSVIELNDILKKK